MKLSRVYEELVAGKTVTIAATAEVIESMTAQLRVIRSRYEAKFNALSGDSLSGGKVVRALLSSDGSKVTFSLAESLKKSKLEYQIVSIDEPEPCENMNLSGQL